MARVVEMINSTNRVVVAVVPTSKMACQVTDLLADTYSSIDFVFLTARGCSAECTLGKFVIKARRQDGKKMTISLEDALVQYARGAIAALKAYSV
jgi:predicted Ser/Thr protein kinase